MSANFKSLCELLEKVEATKKRLEIIDQTANYLKILSPEEIEPATNMMVGRAFPKYSQKTLASKLVNPHPHLRAHKCI